MEETDGTVLRTERIAPRMGRIVLGGDGWRRFRRLPPPTSTSGPTRAWRFARRLVATTRVVDLRSSPTAAETRSRR